KSIDIMAELCGNFIAQTRIQISLSPTQHIGNALMTETLRTNLMTTLRTNEGLNSFREQHGSRAKRYNAEMLPRENGVRPRSGRRDSKLLVPIERHLVN